MISGNLCLPLLFILSFTSAHYVMAVEIACMLWARKLCSFSYFHIIIKTFLQMLMVMQHAFLPVIHSVDKLCKNNKIIFE